MLTDKRKESNKSKGYLYFAIIILYLEIIYKVFVFDNFFNSGLFYTILFSIQFALVPTILTKLFKTKINKILTFVLTIIFVLYFEAQFIFIKLLSVPFSFNTIGLAGQATDFYDVIGSSILTNIVGVILFLMPLVFLIIINKRIDYSKAKKKELLRLFACFIISIIIPYLSLLPSKNKLYSAYQLYYKVDAPNLINDRFGLLTGTKIDIKRVIFGLEESLIIDEFPNNENKDDKTQKDVTYNISDIDFKALAENEKDETLKNMHNYFANESATNQNEYTGIFKDKNLIFVVAEGFNQIAVQKDVTPILYKLSNEGIVFNNFYTPLMLSTIGGEFQALTGLVPTQETINVWSDKTPKISYALGNSFSKANYNVQAFHDWTYTYYKRDITRPTLGFSNYVGCRNGLEKLMNCNTWPTSDIEMIKAITPKIINGKSPTATYILTVSGHANYTWTGNYIAAKNKKLVDGLTYSENIKGYLATQIELDKALELLLKNLSDAGELENTVIALVGDHYPYSLTTKEINELSDYERDELFGVNHSNFMIWNSEIETTKIDKIGSQIDVLPTLLNLFGIEYDSRLIIGKDILSDANGLAIFANRSWISDKGRYNSEIKEFIPNNNVTVDDNYIDKMNTIVSNKFTMSKLIINKNYYSKVLK